MPQLPHICAFWIFFVEFCKRYITPISAFYTFENDLSTLLAFVWYITKLIFVLLTKIQSPAVPLRLFLVGWSFAFESCPEEICQHYQCPEETC